MQHAAGARMLGASVDFFRQFFGGSSAACIEQVNDGSDRPPLRVHTQHVMPESAGGHGRWSCSSGSELAVNFRKTFYHQARELIGIHLDAAVRRGANLKR